MFMPICMLDTYLGIVLKPRQVYKRVYKPDNGIYVYVTWNTKTFFDVIVYLPINLSTVSLSYRNASIIFIVELPICQHNKADLFEAQVSDFLMYREQMEDDCYRFIMSVPTFRLMILISLCFSNIH